MYNHTKLKQEFWTAFGQYMSPVVSADGEKKGWINYKTGIRNVFFKMDAGKDFALIGIFIRHPEIREREIFLNRLAGVKNILEENVGENWTWERNAVDEHGHGMARIYTQLNGVNIYNREDWPKVISFLKAHIVGLDAFWTQVRELME